MSTKRADIKRTPEREELAAAILERDEAAEQIAALRQAQQRAEADLFLARRDVEAAEAALKRRPNAEALVAAYMAGREPDRTPMRAVHDALDEARSRLADLAVIAAALRAEPVFDANWRVENAVKAVVAADPAVRRLVAEYDRIIRSFRMIHATAGLLDARNMVPEGLKAGAWPKVREPYLGEPDPAWLAAIERLGRDPDAVLPE